MEDLTQEVFLNICRGGSNYDGVSNVEAYLYGIANNAVYRHLRKHKKYPNRKNQTKKKVVAKPQDLINEDEEHFLVRFSRAIASLPNASRQALKLLFVEDMSPSDAADQLGCSPEAFRQRLRRGLAMLPKDIFEN